MAIVSVFYATREGHTRRIAGHVAVYLCKCGFEVKVMNVRDHAAATSLDKSGAAILLASVHAGSHEPEMLNFVKEHRDQLEGMPTAFLSVTLSEAGAERTGTTPEEHSRFVADVQAMLDRFFEESRWHPKRVKPLAGALLYTKYNFLTRFMMKRIAKKSGGSTDTSRDHDYTDWLGLERFVTELAAEWYLVKGLGSVAPV